jgi:hypothetical protein
MVVPRLALLALRLRWAFSDMILVLMMDTLVLQSEVSHLALGKA